VRVGSEMAVAPSASGRVLVAFQDPEIMELRIRESMVESSADELKAFRKDIHKAAVRGFSSIDSHQYAGVHAISFPVLDTNRHAIAAITVPMLPRIDGVAQMSQGDVEAVLRQSVSRLSERIG
jgi:DNA-binding IclR family transcriptional regulator